MVRSACDRACEPQPASETCAGSGRIMATRRMWPRHSSSVRFAAAEPSHLRSWASSAQRPCRRLRITTIGKSLDALYPVHQASTPPAKSYTSIMAAMSYLDRLLEPLTDAFTPKMASILLGLRIDPEMEAHIGELRQKANAGALTAAEDAEYKDFVEAVDLISIMQAKARRFLAKRSALAWIRVTGDCSKTRWRGVRVLPHAAGGYASHSVSCRAHHIQAARRLGRSERPRTRLRPLQRLQGTEPIEHRSRNSRGRGIIQPA